MKNRFKTWMIYLLLAFILCLPLFVWFWKPSTPLNLVVIDKTVPLDDFREHLGLFWVLHHTKVVDDEDKKLYEKEVDYYGYHPERSEGDDVLEVEESPDLIYVADTYGVYEADFDGNFTGERSEKIYGGLTFFEWNRILASKSEHTTLIVEFNTIQSPTEENVRSIVERNLSIQWTGWIGRYFPDLDDIEVPIWLKTNYEKQTNNEWTFKGPGLTFVNENDYVVVLEEEDITGSVKFYWTELGKSHYNEKRESEYSYWFDIIEPGPEMEAEGMYSLMLTDTGEEILNEHEIPTTFPAILKHKEESIYYFAGDFADIKQDHWAKWVLPSPIYSLMAILNKDEQFFWEVYIPLMKVILHEANSQKTSSQSVGA